jgi:intraflagellar transport protein 52
MFKFDTDMIPEAVNLYKELNVKHEIISLITPTFETPLPPLQAATFPPSMKELPPPSLDLFDLDEQFSSEKVRLAQTTNKCTDDDLPYYIQECGEILGVDSAIQNRDDPKAILQYIFSELVKFKKHNQE